MKFNFKSLALCAAMLSFGFAKNTDRIYANHTQICNAIDKDKKQIDNIYTVFTGVIDNPQATESTGKWNILYFDVTRQGIPHLTDFSQLRRVTSQDLGDHYEFLCNYGKLHLACYYCYGTKGPFIVCDVYATEKFDLNPMEPIYNMMDSNLNETDKKCQRVVGFYYFPFCRKSATLNLFTVSDKTISLDAYQKRLEQYGLSIQELAAIGKELMRKAPIQYNDLQPKVFTEDDKELFIKMIKDARDNINSRRFEKAALQFGKIFYKNN